MQSEPRGEEARLAALDRYDILDTSSEESFDRVTRLVRRIFRVPMSTITFIDGHRQWFKSQSGLVDRETDREPAFCNFAVSMGAPLVVEDALADPRFANNPFVLGPPHIRFYAGIPLITPDGQAIGTLCAMDRTPRSFEMEELATLSDLANFVMSELELRALSATDRLTGALSRRSFKEEGARMLAAALHHGHPLSCIVFDLDKLKAVNDNFGFACGNRILCESLAVCRPRLRQADLLGRISGDEFGLLLPHMGRADAIQLAEVLRATISTTYLDQPKQAVSISASFGVAAADRSVTDVDFLVKGAESALAEAKREGGNRCREWCPGENALTSVRRRVFKAGRIFFNFGRSTVDCTVRRLDEKGAALDVVSSAGIPHRFKLQIESDHLFRGCRILSKTEKHIDAAFESEGT